MRWGLRLLSLLAIALLGVSCSSAPTKWPMPNRDSIPATQALPIEGLWKNPGGAMLRLEGGRMYFHSGFNQTASSGMVAVRHIVQTSARGYSCARLVDMDGAAIRTGVLFGTSRGVHALTGGFAFPGYQRNCPESERARREPILHWPA